MKPRLNTGYERVGLRKKGVQKGHYVHRLVAEAFLTPEPGRPFVNHKDGNKANNNLENLEWCTQSENQIHAYQLGLQKSHAELMHQVAHEKNKIPIKQFTMNGLYIRTFDSIQEAAESMGKKCGSHISAVAKGKRSHCGGYKWKY